MNIKYNKILCALWAIFAVFLIGFAVNFFDADKVISADDSVVVITESDTMLDPSLFKKLRNYYNQKKPDDARSDISTDMFLDDVFLGETLDLHGFDGERIFTLANFDLFDLSKFDGIDLKDNLVQNISTILKKSNFKNIDLSNNYLTNFDYLNINFSKVTNLNLCDNYIETCNLSGLRTAISQNLEDEVPSTVINVENNYITVDSLTLPTDQTVIVYLSHNKIQKAKLLEKLETETLNENIFLGYQGPKWNESFSVNAGMRIEFYEFDDVTEIVLQKANLSSVSTETLINQMYNFKPQTYVDFQTFEKDQTLALDSPGYFKVLFREESQNNEQSVFDHKKSIEFYVMPTAPKIVMMQDGKIVEFANKVSNQVEIKIENPEQSVTYFFKNAVTGEILQSDTLKLSNYGKNYYVAYQLVEGCISDGKKISVEYQKNVAIGWTYVLIGVGVFALVGWIVYINIPRIASFGLGKKAKNKKNLD